MALNFFKQRDIDEMDPFDIPEEFINYFDTLSEERKAEIIASRPDLADGLGYIVPKKEADKIEIIIENDDVEEPEEDIFEGIRNNRYMAGVIDDYFVDGMNNVEALTVPDKTDRCPVHRTRFEEKQIKYRPNVIKLGRKSGSTYGMLLRFCRECRRIYIEESKRESIHKELEKRSIQHTFYDMI